MVLEKKLEDVLLKEIPWMLRWVKFLVLLDCSWKLVAVVGLCYQFRENYELHPYLFLNLLKAGKGRHNLFF